MEEKISYYMVIPMPIFNDKGLTKTEKLLYGLISSLANKDGYCYASNEYLAEKMDIKDKTTISKLLKNLENKGYIKIILERNGAIIKNRKIFINHEWLKCQPLNEQNLDDKRKCANGKNANRTNGKNAKYNNINFKGINNYIKEINKESFFENNDLNETFKEYLKMRYEKKCKATETTIDRLIKKLNKKDIDTAIAMLNYSIENGYQGVFELKKDKPKKEPEWFGKEIEKEKLTKQEQEEIEQMLKAFS